MEPFRTRDQFRAAVLWMRTGGMHAPDGKRLVSESKDYLGIEVVDGKGEFKFSDQENCQQILDQYFEHRIIGDFFAFTSAYFEMRRRLNQALGRNY